MLPCNPYAAKVKALPIIADYRVDALKTGDCLDFRSGNFLLRKLSRCFVGKCGRGEHD